ncbi:MAG: hypothetical protein HY242_03105 [Afipia sp.]|nr:hypothetical protein [Afipia sp.]
MTVIIVIVWSVIGFIAGGMIATELGPLFGWRHMEGMSAYFGLLFGSPIGLIAGAVFGWRNAQHYGTDAKRRGNFLFLTLLGVGALVAAAFAFEAYRTRDDLEDTLWLTCYMRLPEGVSAPPKDTKSSLELRSAKETRRSSPYNVPAWEMKDGRATAQNSVEVYRASADRKVAVTIEGGPTYVFKLDAPARPKRYSYEGDWIKPDSVEGAGGAGLEVKCGM